MLHQHRQVTWFLLFVSLINLFVDGDRHLNANGAFGKAHRYNNEPSPYACDRGAGLLSRLFLPRQKNLQQLNVSKTNYSSSDIIQITWRSFSTSCKDDFIGIYSIDVPLNSACDYYDYEFIINGQQNTTWSMVNLRRPLEFRYYSRDHFCSGNYSLVARSTILRPSNPNEAVHVHLSYGDRIDQIYVSYLTNSSEYIPQCQYGLSAQSLTFSQSGTTTTYTASDMCEGKANRWGPQNFIDPGYMHTILLENLRPSTTYYYRVGTPQHGWSKIFSFTNRPSSADELVSILAFGDMGVSPVEPGAGATINRLTDRVLSMNITCLIHIGDISYARGIGVLWDAFMTQLEPIAARIPYMVGIGNHEYDHVEGGEKDPSGAPSPGGFRPEWGNYGYDSGGECAVPMVRRFHSPSNGNGLFWYSFDVGPVHILHYSTEHDFRQSSIQYAWIEKDLQSVDRTRTPWLIVGAHRPMYASETDEPYDFIKLMLQAHLEPLFYRYRVDLNLFAHKHSYERTCPMYKERCVPDGIIHLLIGMAGQDIDDGGYSGAEWSIYHDQEYGYTQFWANRTYLHFEYYHNKDDAIADQLTLYK